MKIDIGPYPEPLPDNSGYYPRKVEINIHDYDTWNVDVTISLIIEPLLLKYRKSVGSNFAVDDEDLSEDLRWGDSWQEHKYNWVLDEIIFAANAINTDWEVRHLDRGFCTPEYEAENKRITNGFRLFGKYMRAFWN